MPRHQAERAVEGAIPCTYGAVRSADALWAGRGCPAKMQAHLHHCGPAGPAAAPPPGPRSGHARPPWARTPAAPVSRDEQLATPSMSQQLHCSPGGDYHCGVLPASMQHATKLGLACPVACRWFLPCAGSASEPAPCHGAACGRQYCHRPQPTAANEVLLPSEAPLLMPHGWLVPWQRCLAGQACDRPAGGPPAAGGSLWRPCRPCWPPQAGWARC